MVVENMVSGGSSPSREVQEIMALTNFDKNSQIGDDLMDWPKPPEMPICTVASNSASIQGQSMELANAANLIYHSMASNSMPSSDMTAIENRLQDLIGKYSEYSS